MTEENIKRLTYASRLLKNSYIESFTFYGGLRFDAASIAREVRAELAFDSQADGYYCAREEKNDE